MDKIPTQIMVKFCLSNVNVDINTLFSQIGISSAKIQYKECIKVKEYAKDSWCLSTGYQDEMAISIPFEQLISNIGDKIDVINNLIIKYNLECIFIIIVRAEMGNGPEMILSQKCINFASKFNAEVHFDLYFF